MFRLHVKTGASSWEGRRFQVRSEPRILRCFFAENSDQFEDVVVEAVRESQHVLGAPLKGCGFAIEIKDRKPIALCAASVAQKNEFVQLLVGDKAGETAILPRASRSSGAGAVLTRAKSDGSIEKRNVSPRSSTAEAHTSPRTLAGKTSPRSTEKSADSSISSISPISSSSSISSRSSQSQSQSSSNRESAFLLWCQQTEARIDELTAQTKEEQREETKNTLAQIKADVDSSGKTLLELCKSSGIAKARMEIILSRIMQLDRAIGAASRRKSERSEKVSHVSVSAPVAAPAAALRKSGAAETEFFDWIKQKNAALDELADAPPVFTVIDMTLRAIKMEEIKGNVVTQGKAIFQKTLRGVEVVSAMSRLVDRIRKGEKAIAYALNIAANKEEVVLPVVDLVSEFDDEATIIIPERKLEQRSDEQKKETYARKGTILCLTGSTVEVENLAHDFERELNYLLGI